VSLTKEERRVVRWLRGRVRWIAERQIYTTDEREARADELLFAIKAIKSGRHNPGWGKRR
jgi:hypothetical protein